MILHSDREGNDCIRKLRCHCIQIMHSDIYSVQLDFCNKDEENLEGNESCVTNCEFPLSMKIKEFCSEKQNTGGVLKIRTLFQK